MTTSKGNNGKSAAAVAPARDHKQVDELLRKKSTAPEFCAQLAAILHVRPTEVALLRLEKGLLRFLFPDELKTAGAIPISSSSAVAAHTASSKKVELFNNFSKVKHASIFETVKLATSESSDLAPIQKLMSAPVMNREGQVVGVIQVSRKGLDISMAGADFTLDNLNTLERAAQTVAEAPFMKGA
jgi:hypothetical protein